MNERAYSRGVSRLCANANASPSVRRSVSARRILDRGFPAKMGRTPAPTSLKVLRGNPGQRPLNAEEPIPPPADPNPPSNLAGVALEKWDEMVDLLSKMGVFTAADRQPLQRYCLMYEQWLALEAHCREHGWTQVTQSGYSQITAEATLIKSLRADMLAIERQFGMTPAARSSIKAPGASAPENPLAAYISRRGG